MRAPRKEVDWERGRGGMEEGGKNTGAREQGSKGSMATGMSGRRARRKGMAAVTQAPVLDRNQESGGGRRRLNVERAGKRVEVRGKR